MVWNLVHLRASWWKREESEKAGLKLNIQKTKITASSPITPWQIDGETGNDKRLFSGAPKSLQLVTAAMKFKRHLILGRKAMTNLDSILKSRDITLPTLVFLVKAMVFPVVMYGCECWTLKKAECQRIDALELWCWRRLLRVYWTARRPSQSILKEISPEYSLEGLMLKLKLQYLSHLMLRTDSLEKTLMLGKIAGGSSRDDRGWEDWMASLTWWTCWSWTGKPSVQQSMESQKVRHEWVTELNGISDEIPCMMASTHSTSVTWSQKTSKWNYI